MKANSVLDTIGGTPHIRMSRLFPDAEVWIKSERANPAGSIKDRIALAMVEAAEASGELQPGGTIVEPTSGNTGVGLAMVAAVKGYKLVLVMPESMSVERRRLMQAYGATFELTPKEGGMKAAIARATELATQGNNAWMPHQFENQANIDVHLRTTVPEILADFPDGVDVIITGVGTGGHITACGEALKERWPGLKVFAVEPEGWDDLARSLAGGALVPATGGSGLCDALLVPVSGALTFEINRARLAGGLVVSDDEVLAAMAFAFTHLKLVVEPGGAVALAALLSGRVSARGRVVGAVLSGGNVDPAVFARALAVAGGPSAGHVG